MFADMVDSTRISSRLDPEDLHQLVSEYQGICETIVRNFDGHVAQYLGDGVLAYFGYPRAHEDDARRAIHAALRIVDEVSQLSDRLRRTIGFPLSVRVGIHTGLVVVAQIGRDQLAVGETPNVAARMQSVGQSNTVTVSWATHRLTSKSFRFERLESISLKGIEAEKRSVYRVMAPIRLPLRMRGAESWRLIGRTRELADLLTHLAEVEGVVGRGAKVVVVSGEAGIGKSSLVNVAADRADARGMRVFPFRCSPYYVNSALYPIIESLKQTLRIKVDGDPQLALDRIDRLLRRHDFPVAESAPYLAALLGLPTGDRYGAPLRASDLRKPLQRLLVDMLYRQAAARPFLLVGEDLHWADPSTLELLSLILERQDPSRLLLLLTHRPEFVPRFLVPHAVSHVILDRLSDDEGRALVLRTAEGSELPAHVINEIVSKTDGIPLFIEEMTKAVLETARALGKGDAGATVAEGARPGLIPSTLQGLLMARLDLLPEAKPLAQFASALGREFSLDLLKEVAGLPEERVRSDLERLREAGLLNALDGEQGSIHYQFKHALVRDAAYESLLRSSRPEIHRRIADTLEARFTAEVQAAPELLAYHLTQAGLPERAVPYWQMAGLRAASRSEYHEAAAHIGAALELLRKLPETRQWQELELDLTIANAGAMRATRGFAALETGQAFVRARGLCRRLGETRRLIPALNGLYAYHLVHGEHDAAGEVARELLETATRLADRSLIMIGHRAVGAVLFHTGHPLEARRHLETALAMYDQQTDARLAAVYGTDHASTTSCFLGLTLWVLGYRDQSLRVLRWATEHSIAIGHIHSEVQARTFLALNHLLARELQDVEEPADWVRKFSVGYAFPLMEASAYAWIAAAKAPRELTAENIAAVLKGARAMQATGSNMYVPYLIVHAAALYERAGNLPEGLAALAEATAMTESSNERWAEPELHRVRAALLGAPPAPRLGEAEEALRTAMRIAGAQGARIWQLRAAVDLADLLRRQDRSGEARDLLAPEVAWFSEGLDTPDLRAARELLDRLQR
jgi:class 3 adenylate cyclase/predicted ATPase